MMPRLLQPLWLLLASTADSKLALVVEYLKAENQISPSTTLLELARHCTRETFRPRTPLKRWKL